MSNHEVIAIENGVPRLLNPGGVHTGNHEANAINSEGLVTAHGVRR
jgi:hypothetical protein